MNVARILQFGSPERIQNTEVARPTPGSGQVLVPVKAAGVGPWDALIREGKSAMGAVTVEVLPEPSTTYMSLTYV